MMRMLSFIREHYHPLFRLRRFRTFQKLTRYLDMPLAIRFPAISHPVYVSLTKKLSFVLSGGVAGEERERKHFVDLVQLAGFHRFFDVGANIGLYGFMFRTIVANSVVTMFEPDEANARLIRRTIDRAALLEVQLTQAAVSDHEGTVIFYNDELSGATGSIRRGGQEAFISRHHRYKPSEVDVRSVTLDGLVNGSDDPDFIKIDVEGAELSVLHGSERLIERSHPALFFECDEDQAEISSFLSKRGYVFLDFSSMRRVEELVHNNLALHSTKHAALLGDIGKKIDL
jgi:FkbM family methyltransferase